MYNTVYLIVINSYYKLIFFYNLFNDTHAYIPYEIIYFKFSILFLKMFNFEYYKIVLILLNLKMAMQVFIIHVI